MSDRSLEREQASLAEPSLELPPPRCPARSLPQRRVCRWPNLPVRAHPLPLGLGLEGQRVL